MLSNGTVVAMRSRFADISSVLNQYVGRMDPFRSPENIFQFKFGMGSVGGLDECESIAYTKNVAIDWEPWAAKGVCK